MFTLDRSPDGMVRLRGRLDAAAADQAKSDFASLSGPVVADCSELEYISSAGIAVLLILYQRLHTQGLPLRLVAVTPRVRNVFQYAGLDKLLGIE